MASKAMFHGEPGTKIKFRLAIRPSVPIMELKKVNLGTIAVVGGEYFDLQ